ncbi:MAG: hypothetical protein WB696_09975 [Chthoniobacterales bacterium]
MSISTKCDENDDIGEIRDEIREYKKQLDLVKEDLEIIIRFYRATCLGRPTTLKEPQTNPGGLNTGCANGFLRDHRWADAKPGPPDRNGNK